MKIKKLLAAVFVCAAISGVLGVTAFAAELTVGEGGAYETVQAALEAAGSGDTIVLQSDVELNESVTIPEGVAINRAGITL